MSQQIKIKKVIDGKTYEITGTVDFKDMDVKLIDTTPVDPVDPEPGVEKPTEGTIKEGGWGANNDAKTWTVVNMRKPPEEFKVIDDKKVNVVTNFKTKESAQNFINYFKVNPFPPEPEPNPEPEPTPGGGDEVDGIKLPYKTTSNIRKDPFRNERDDGLRLDFKGQKGKEYVNSLMIFYGTFKDTVPDDDITFKWSWGNHSKKGDLVKAYGIGLNNKDGNLRGRMEWNHPSYTSNLVNGKGGLPIQKGKSFGYMGVKKTLPNGNVLLEYYQDQGGLGADGKPSNQWKKLLTWEDSEYKVTDYSENGCTGTIRIDDENKGFKNVDVKLAYFIEIQP